MRKIVIIIMGVSGSGKTTIGELLAERLNSPFYDGDVFHPKSNIKKMEEGIPLSDSDREPWLSSLAMLASESLLKSGAVIACSALKKKYRDMLKGDHQTIHFVYLKGPQKLIYERMRSRKGHYMCPDLLQSQFDTLEEPSDALTVSIEASPEEIVELIITNVQ